MRSGRDSFPSLSSVDWNLSATKIEGEVFLKGGQRRAGGWRNREEVMFDSTLNQIHFQFTLTQWWTQQKNDGICLFLHYFNTLLGKIQYSC